MEGGFGADDLAVGIGGRRGRRHHRQEAARRDFRQQHLDREQHPAQRRVEGGGDAGARAGGQQDDLLRADQAEQRARVDPKEEPIWMIGPSRPTEAPGADRDGGGKGFHHGDDAADVAVLVIDREHHLRHAMPLGLGREGLDQQDHDQPADHRHQNDERPPRARVAIGIRIKVEGENSVKGDVVDDREQILEHDRACGGRRRQRRKSGEYQDGSVKVPVSSLAPSSRVAEGLAAEEIWNCHDAFGGLAARGKSLLRGLGPL